jgi:glycogen(starch) synthase
MLMGVKVLVVSDVYPPHHLGGYELGCRDVVEMLRSRRHEVFVLTSTFRNGKIENPTGENNIERSLQYNTSPADPPHDKWAECRILSRAIKRFQPEVVYFWNQTGLCYWLPMVAWWEGCSQAFFLSDTSFVSWRVAAWLGGVARTNVFVRAVLGKTFLVRGKPVVENQVCHFASEFLRTVAAKHNIRLAPKDSLVAHWGVEQSQFTVAPRARWPVKRLLYVGQMIQQKGVHTAIRAMAILAGEKEFAGLTLTLVGGAYLPDYEKSLRELTVQLGLGERVIFRGKRPRTELSQIYAEHDVLVFPSEWDEPFAITPLEGIASGLAVVGTTTGGSGELFRNRETAMTFRAGEAEDCARAIRELCADNPLFETIRGNALRIVRERHTLEAMVNAIEKSLLKTVSPT